VSPALWHQRLTRAIANPKAMDMNLTGRFNGCSAKLNAAGLCHVWFRSKKLNGRNDERGKRFAEKSMNLDLVVKKRR